MKQTKFKNQNAITLVALVITILVLLILAGVALSLVVGENGITERSITARKTYDIAGAKEQVETLVGEYATEFYEKKYIQGSTTADTIGKYISEKLNGQTVGDYTISTTDSQEITITNGTNTATGKINDNGSTEWNSSSSTAKWAYSTDESGNTVVTDGAQVLKIGDYVNYDPQTGATNKTYKSLESKNGYGDQEFDLTTYYNGWRVLGVDESTGEVLLVAEKFVGPKTGGYTNSTYGTTYYYLKGQKGYQYGIDELNKISELYGQGKYATGGRSITADDVNKITGFDPTSYDRYGKEVTYYWDGTDNPYYEGINLSVPNNLFYSHNSGFNWFDTTTETWKNLPVSSTVESGSKEKIVTLINTCYWEDPNGISQGEAKGMSFNSIEYKLLFGDYGINSSGVNRVFTGTGAQPMYWLGSASVDCGMFCVSFGSRIICDGGVSYDDLADSNGSEHDAYYGVMPVVNLQSGIKVEYNTITEEWDFVE